MQDGRLAVVVEYLVVVVVVVVLVVVVYLICSVFVFVSVYVMVMLSVFGKLLLLFGDVSCRCMLLFIGLLFYRCVLIV